MRWPLKNQILVRMLVLLTLAIAAITWANIRSTMNSKELAVQEKVGELARLLSTTRFPLNASILENMKSLSGAEFILVSNDNQTLAKTSLAPKVAIAELPHPDNEGKEVESRKIVFEGTPFYHVAVKTISNIDRNTSQVAVHIFVRRETNATVFWKASVAPLIIAGIVFPIALLTGLALAGQVTRPLATLREQVQGIAQGQLDQIAEVKRNDEIRDLNLAVNEMVVKLRDHENQLRQYERLSARVQFGSGIVHHLRNSAAGCKLAVELLASESQAVAESDNYQVAVRQLGLMNNYIKKFLMHSKSTMTTSDDIADVNLAEVLDSVIYLLRPSAEHLSVVLNVDCEDDFIVPMTLEDAEQLMMNLITNAIAAASRVSADGKNETPAMVSICLRRELTDKPEPHQIVLTVEDTGNGPPKEIKDSLFEPFVTGSKEGTGLGLSLVQEIADRIGGQVGWRRENDRTMFRFEFGSEGASSEKTNSKLNRSNQSTKEKS